MPATIVCRPISLESSQLQKRFHGGDGSCSGARDCSATDKNKSSQRALRFPQFLAQRPPASG